MTAQRAEIPSGTVSANALDYSLNCWTEMTRYMHDARLPIDSTFKKPQISPWATGRKNWLFVGTLLPVNARRRSRA